MISSTYNADKHHPWAPLSKNSTTGQVDVVPRWFATKEQAATFILQAGRDIVGYAHYKS